MAIMAGPRAGPTPPSPATSWATRARACTGSPARPTAGRCWWATRPGCPPWPRSRRGCPRGCAPIALVEVEDAAERQPIDSAADLDLRWLHRDGAPAGQTTLLADAVRELELPDGPGRAWGGGEALAMRDVRRHLKDERGLPGEDTQILGYWKHRATESWE